MASGCRYLCADMTVAKRLATAGIRTKRLCSPSASSMFFESGFSFSLSATPATPSSFSCNETHI